MDFFWLLGQQAENTTSDKLSPYQISMATLHPFVPVFWPPDAAAKPNQQAKIGNNCNLHATWQGSASEVRTPGAPDPVVREGHPAIVTFTHKQ